jgi:hypothetical protein
MVKIHLWLMPWEMNFKKLKFLKLIKRSCHRCLKLW